jgi:prepilin-type N-terminal cleavage/methylation domain-containing protein
VKRAFTLFELLAVVIIIGILAAWGVPNYVTTKEKGADKEAISNLQIMQSAEKAYKLDVASLAYYSGTDTATINQNLHLSLPTGANRNWNYTTYSTGCVQARRNGNDNRYWNLTMTDAINNTNTTPSSALVCP